ncbi:MAG: 23S rRNA (guanosine(2251)-2'-O)-methyltransferase RlmB [Deltaproteobacteria bacterium]|nr:23S rRNA (guanosine(2251)-2'-O)-methyltransferase RlmB [Deltaproteobacteria bacterium]
MKKHLIPGLHSVKEALVSGRIRVHEIWISEGRDPARAREILEIARQTRIPVINQKQEVLNDALPGTAHQGIIAVAGEFAYIDLEDLIEISKKSPGQGLLIAIDHITDEGNLGAIIRSAVFFGVQGIIIPKDRSAQITQNVIKRSAGTYLNIPVARVVNLSRALDLLRDEGFWIIGTAGEGTESIYCFDWHRDTVLVLGSEDKGMGHMIRNKCHQIVGIPSSGNAESLNVSVACGVILSEIIRQRGEA